MDSGEWLVSVYLTSLYKTIVIQVSVSAGSEEEYNTELCQLTKASNDEKGKCLFIVPHVHLHYCIFGHIQTSHSK